MLPVTLHQWFSDAPQYPGTTLLDLSPHVAVESTRLPGGFHRDPADQIIVATARLQGCALVTADQSILAYPHVHTPYNGTRRATAAEAGARAANFYLSRLLVLANRAISGHNGGACRAVESWPGRHLNESLHAWKGSLFHGCCSQCSTDRAS